MNGAPLELATDPECRMKYEAVQANSASEEFQRGRPDHQPEGLSRHKNRRCRRDLPSG